METVEQFFTRLQKKYHWTDEGKMNSLMEVLRKRRITTIKVLKALWDDIKSELPLSIGIETILEKEINRK